MWNKNFIVTGNHNNQWLNMTSWCISTETYGSQIETENTLILLEIQKYSKIYHVKKSCTKLGSNFEFNQNTGGTLKLQTSFC